MKEDTLSSTTDGRPGVAGIAAMRGMREAIHSDRRARPIPILVPAHPVAIIGGASPAEDTTMAQRESLPAQLAEQAYTIKRRRMIAAQAPDSPGGVHITTDEHAEIATIDAFERTVGLWLRGDRLSEQIRRLGLLAPSVQRSIREVVRDLYGDGMDCGCDDTPAHGMRR